MHATISLHFGTVETLKGKDVIGSMAASALIRGTKDKNRQEIQDDNRQAQSAAECRRRCDGANVGIETVGANLIPVLRLASEILQKPTIPESEFEEIRKTELTSLEYSKSEPQALGPPELARALKPFPRGDVRRAVSIEEQIEDVTKAKVEDARAFHKQFYGANHGEVAIVGDFDPAEAKKALTRVFRIVYEFRSVRTGQIRFRKDRSRSTRRLRRPTSRTRSS